MKVILPRISLWREKKESSLINKSFTIKTREKVLTTCEGNLLECAENTSLLREWRLLMLTTEAAPWEKPSKVKADCLVQMATASQIFYGYVFFFLDRDAKRSK